MINKNAFLLNYDKIDWQNRQYTFLNVSHKKSFTSISNTSAIEQIAKQSSAGGYLSKPFEIAELEKLVKGLA